MKKSVTWYLLCTFITSWLLWGGLAVLMRLNLVQYGSPLFALPYMLGGIMPAVCEILLKKKLSSREEFKAFLKSIISPKHSLPAYLMILGMAAVFCALPLLWGGAETRQPLYMAALLFPAMILGGGLEEIGWRGFLQPTLETRFSPLASTLMVGPIWAVWHLPLWFIPNTNQAGDNFLWFSLFVLAMSFLFTAVYRLTRSIFLCIVLHALINALWEVFVPRMDALTAVLLMLVSLGCYAALMYLHSRRGARNARQLPAEQRV